MTTTINGVHRCGWRANLAISTNDESNDDLTWVGGVPASRNTYRKIVFGVQDRLPPGGGRGRLTRMATTPWTNNHKVCILGYNQYGETGHGCIRNFEIYGGGGVNAECLYVNHQGSGPRAQWATNQDWQPGVDYGNPTGASAPFAFAASATVPNPAVTLAAAEYNALLSAATTAVVGPNSIPLDGYQSIGAGMCHDEPATLAQYRFVETDAANPGICRDKCSLHNRGLLTGARYVNASGHCEAYEVGGSTCHWYAPPAGDHVMVTSLSSVGNHIYYGTADTPLYCFASTVPPPPPSPPHAPARPPTAPITDDLVGLVEELSPMDSHYRFSVAELQVFSNHTLSPYDCLMACNALDDCDYAAWRRSDCQTNGLFQCVLGVYDANPTTPAKHGCYTEGAFRHFVFNTSRICDSPYNQTGVMTCPESMPHCLGHIPRNIMGTTQFVGACNADPNADTHAYKPPPPLGGVCRNTCISPTPNNRSQWLPSSACGRRHLRRRGLDAKAFGNPAAFACAYGTDCADCGVRPSLPVPLVPIPLCENTCTGYEYAYDSDGDGYTEGIACRDSYIGRARMPWEDSSERPFTGYCGFGTDCAHCGVRHAEGVVHEAMACRSARRFAHRLGAGGLRAAVDRGAGGMEVSAAATATATTVTHSHTPHSHTPASHSHSPHSHTPSYGGYGRRK